MVRLILSILLFIILSIFVALNAQYTTTINLFGYELENTSVAAIVTITLAVGVVYSFILYVSNYFAKYRADRLKTQKRKNKQKAVELAEQAKEIRQISQPGPSEHSDQPEVPEAPDIPEQFSPQQQQQQQPQMEPPPRKKPFGLFRKRTKPEEQPDDPFISDARS